MTRHIKEWADKTAEFRVRVVFAVASAGFAWSVIGIISLPVPAQSQQPDYQYNAVAAEQRFTRLEEKLATALDQLKEIKEGQDGGTLRGYGMLLLLSGLLGEAGIRIVRGKRD